MIVVLDFIKKPSSIDQHVGYAMVKEITFKQQIPATYLTK